MRSLDGRGNEGASAVLNVHDVETTEGVHGAELVRARRLVADSKVESADLVVTVLAARSSDVVESGVVVEPRANRAAHIGVDRVGSHEGKLAIGGLDDAGTFGHRSHFVLCWDTTAHGRLLCSAGTDVKVVPCVVADVECTAGGVNLEKVDRSSVGSNAHAEVVAVRLHGPVGNTVDVNEAA